LPESKRLSKRKRNAEVGEDGKLQQQQEVEYNEKELIVLDGKSLVYLIVILWVGYGFLGLKNGGRVLLHNNIL
jgi:hypothetical protein